MAEAAVAYVSLALASPGIGGKIAKDIEGGADRGSALGSNSIIKNLAGITAKVGGIAAGIGTALILKGGWDRLIQIEDATASMTVALGDATAAGELLDKVMGVVTGTPFSYSNFAAAASNLAGFGVEAVKIPGILTAIADAAATKGSRAQEFADRLGTSFGQMAARGVVGMDQINSLAEVGVNGLAILANNFGVTTDEMSKMISNGAIPASDAIDILVAGIEDGSTGVAGATTAFSGMAQALGETTSGKLANMKTAFVNLGAQAIEPLIPAITSLVEQFTGFAKEAGPQVGTVMKDVAGFIKDNTGAVIGLVGAVAGAIAIYVAWKAVSIGVAIVKDIASLARMTAAVVVNTGAWIANKAQTVAIMALYAGEFVKNLAMTIAGLARQSGAWVVNTAAKIANGAVDLAGGIKMWIQYALMMLPQLVAQTGAWITNTGAMIAQKAAQIGAKAATIAGVAAMAIATAAQWAWNAAMSANPISLIIIAIIALIAGLIWFFTQTELGQEMWANFTQFLAEAWANISQFFIEAWTNISSFFTTTWQGIVDFFVGIWDFIVAFITAYINLVLLIITTVINAIVTAWNAVWDGISSFFTMIWTGIVAFVTAYINTVQTIITTVVNVISTVWSNVWNGISSFFVGIWNGIIAVIGTVQGAFSNVFNGIAGIVRGAFNGVVGIVRGVINGIIDAVNGAIGGINDVASAVGGALGLDISIGKIPRLASGGIISSRPGGILANIGEGRYDEAVVPLTPKFMDALAGGSGGSGPAREVNQTNNFYEQRTDPRVLLREAGRELKAAGL